MEQLFEKSFTYNPTLEPKSLLYDFYFIAGYVFNVHTGDDVIDFQLRDISDEVVKTTSRHMLYALMVSCISELANVEEFCSIPRNYDDVYVTDGISDSEMELYEVLDDLGSRRTDVDNVMTDLHWDPPKIMSAAVGVFTKFDWEDEYGGKLWGEIARTWIKIFESTSTAQRIIWIDHAYDLQHNNDTVFTKLDEYYDDGSLQWLKYALNWKKKNYSITEFYDLVSPSLRSTVAWVGKNIHDITLEQHAQDQKRKISKRGHSPTLEQFLASPQGRDYIVDGGIMSRKGFTLFDSVYLASPMGPLPATIVLIPKKSTRMADGILVAMSRPAGWKSGYSADESPVAFSYPIRRIVPEEFITPDTIFLACSTSQIQKEPTIAPEFKPVHVGDKIVYISDDPRYAGKQREDVVMSMELAYFYTHKFELIHHTNLRPAPELVSVEPGTSS